MLAGHSFSHIVQPVHLSRSTSMVTPYSFRSKAPPMSMSKLIKVPDRPDAARGSPVPLLASLMAIVAGFALTEVTLSSFIPRLLAADIWGRDVHKPGKPRVAEMGGLSTLMGVACSVSIVSILLPSYSGYMFVFLAVLLISAFLGYLDDSMDLGGKLKPALSLIAGIPLVASGLIVPRPLIPLVGRARLTVVYPFIALGLPGVFSMATNMMDPLNGMLASNSIILFSFLALIAAISGNSVAFLLAMVMLGPLISFLRYNRYPAKVFSGNIGSMSIGAALGSLAVLGRVEAPLAIGSIPMLVTGFMILASIGGFKEKAEMTDRPTIAENGMIRANPNPEAPITLISILVVDKAKREPKIVRETNLLFFISGIFALITQIFLM